ncbi:MAG TPA: M14 family zinc carboxypeptidase [Kofleriaceae bacterium]|nr:M14 family zinc carboxypeptidase [Kofleriaceae bacterium]
MRHALVGLALIAGSCSSSPRSPASLVTTAERTEYRRTGRYAEAVQLCHDFAHAYRGVHCVELGRTVEDRPIVALRIARRPRLPAIYIQAGIHAGEIEGKDAGFAALRDLLDGKLAPGALDRFSIIFVPVMNPDGHERFGPNHRVNQRGPEEMGFRTNAARQNLNRDWVKADAPETAAVLGVLRRDDPVLFVDLHTTDGAKFEHDISVTTAPVAPRPDGLEEAAATLSAAMMKRLTELGHLPVPFYPSFVADDDPASGFAHSEAPPRFSTFYMAARGRLGMLVETHSWRTYKERAASTYHALQAVFEDAAEHAAAWRRVADEASRASAALGGTQVTLMWKPGPNKREIEFRGYAYERRPSELSNGTWLVYDERTPQIWKVPLYEELVPAVTVTAPRAGYIIAGGFAPQVAKVLALHGITYAPVPGEPRVQVDAYRATKVTYQPPFEGRTRVAIEGAWAPETRTLERGAIFVPIGQPLGRLVLHLLDPALPDSLAQWGHFNAVFERKEYMEAYVAEAAAREMLAKDPALRDKLDADLAADPELAGSPSRRLDWFYRHHPAWDERVDLVPVYRAAAAPAPVPASSSRSPSR